MITSRGVLSMKSAAIPLDNCNNGDEDASMLTGVSGQNSNKSNGNNHYGSNSNNNININETTLWSKAHDMQASSANANPVLRNINNDMTKGISRKTHQCKMQFTSHERDVKLGSDDLRMSKIIRRLHSETSPAAALELCAKLEMAVRTPVNVGYLTRSFVAILDGMLSLFKQCPPPVLDECSKTLGLIGYINRMSYPIYEEFIMKNYRTHKRMQKYLIVALRTTLSCDTKCDLHIFSEKIMLMLKDFLEGAESPDIFMGISTCIVQFSRNYRDAFECHFTDVVDIIIGWQLEVGQPKHLKAHCAYVLEQLTPYFSKHLDFSYGLLSQFIEDITALDTKERPGERIGAFVGAFNSLLKCLTRMHITCESIVSLALTHLTEILPDLLKLEDTGDDALMNINELLCICLLNGYSEPDAATLDRVIRMQFEHISHWTEAQQLSCLYLLLCTVRNLRARLPASLVQLIFQADAANQPYLTDLRLQNETVAHKLLLRACQETLLIKNVPLLQQAYKHLVQNVDNCIKCLVQPGQLAQTEQPVSDDSQGEANILLIFHLSALAALAKQTSSIIGMYACKPSILELLISNCQAGELSVWSGHPATHHAILSLLVVHCQANHNFRKNSSLLRDGDFENAPSLSSTSPTAPSFGQILKFLAHCLSHAAQLAPMNLKQLLVWTKSLLSECRSKFTILLQHADFLSICESIGTMAAKHAPEESAFCIQTVLDYGTSNLNLELLQLYRETALQQLQVHFNSSQAAYAKIYAQLPLSLTISRRVTSGIGSSPLCVWQQRLSQCTAVRDNVFKDFFERLQTPEQEPFAECLRSLFMRSCQVTVLDDRQEKLAQCVRRCERLATGWLQFEAARYCVDQKLRTTLGKPQDTFLAFEAIVMRYARLLSGCAKEAERQSFDEMSLHQLSNTRANLNMLLGFLDALEKLIYNAAEGSAFALRAPEKPVSAFFRLNNPTCQSWFNRIRIGVVIIAMHCHQPELVIRYAQEILMSQKSQDCTYSQAIVYLAWAFINCRESDSLRGLQVWARSKSDKCFKWLQHAAEQAAGRKELAIAGYRSVLAEDQQSELEPHTRQFVLAQLFECLHSTGQWTQIVELKAQLKQKGDSSQLNPFLQKSNTQLSVLEQVLAKNEVATDELTSALQHLSIWPNENEDRASFSVGYVREKLENIVLQQALDGHEIFELSNSVQQLLDMNWRESLINYSSDQRRWQHLTLLKHIVHKLSSQQEQLSLLPLGGDGSQQELHHHHAQHGAGVLNSSLLLRCVAWTQLLREHCSIDSLGTLYLDTAMAAREEGNQLTCQSMLELFFGQPVPDIAGQLLAQSLHTDNAQLLRGYSELVKCLHLQQQQQQQQHPLQLSELTSINVCTALCLAIQNQTKQQLPDQQSRLVSNMGAELLLTLSDWITARSCCGLTTNMSANMQQLLEQLPECPLIQSTAQPTSLPHGERLVARLINASLQQRPDNEEALIAYGNWCYRWGKKIVDSGSVLSPTDVSAIGEAIGDQLPLDGETLQELLQALRMEQQPGNNCEEDELQTDAQCELRLRRLSLLANKPASVLESIVRIWRRAISNTFDYYKEAARSYFHYLSLKAGAGQESMVQPAQQRFHVDDSNMVTTTLRLLRLIVKHASGLQEVLEQGLKTTPIGPWKVIIPQLFSRLNHHEPYVRKSVCALLCRLAESRPQLVTFPAVVGANRELQATPISTSSSENMAEEATSTNTTTSSSSSSSSYATLLSALTKQSPEVVQHVQLLVKELRRVCLLWDEYWIHSLAHIYNSYVARVNGLSSEFKPDDHEGKQNRFNSWRPQLLNDLEALMAFTAREAETSYERSFKRRFDAPIKSTLEALRHRPYPEAWDKLKQLYHVLQSNMIRGTSSTLKMQTISPVLCDIGRMRISMPGLDAHDEQQPVHIESVESAVCILPTKTKPKKVAFYGSNGQKYTFLFKGLEDLHLDERIMQFLSISNAIMASKNDTPHSCYRAHHYSVIPLGPQSGLISWVDGVTPLFALYKKWQQRQPQPATAASSRRLTDLFYNKLSPLLAKHNMLITDPRRQWPLAALRQVLAELQQETPADLLARELWCHAGSAAEWRQSVRRYTNCMAVMSVIGYVIGLGDRHLDNVLINLSSGDIVHIDYNVCFEKGRTLRIPERVPFRLTQNMVHALGLTGIEGAYRLGCEYVLKVMRKERETLLTLLEAFVYDPLVDWTVNDDASALRRAINVKPSVCTSATNELKFHKKDKLKNKLQDWDAKRRHYVGKLKQCQKFWTKYKEDMLPQLAEMVREIEKLQQIQTQRQATEQELLKLNQRSALIAEINSLGSAIESHSFNTASPRYAIKLCHTETLARQAKLRHADYELVQCLLASYGQCLDQQQLAKFNMRLIQFKLESSSWHNEYLALVELVQCHLPPQALESYDSTRHQLDELFGRLNDLGLQCVEHVQQYAAIMSYYPEQRKGDNIYVRFHDTYANYLANGENCSGGGNGHGGTSTAAIDAANCRNTAQTMESVWLDLNMQLHLLTQRFANEQALAQSQTPSHALLAAIGQSGCSQSQLNMAFLCTLDKANSVFSEYEQSAVDTHDVMLLRHQLQHIHLVRAMCQSVVLPPMEQANDQLIQLQDALAALIQLQHSFEHDVAASLFRLFLLSPNQQHLDALKQLSSEQLAERYLQLLPQMQPLQQQLERREPQQLAIPRALEQQFLQCLQPAYEQFHQMAKSFERVSRSIQLIIDDVQDGPTEQCMELNILKQSCNQLGDACFFELVLQTLEASRSCDLRTMSEPVQNFVQRLQSDYIVGLVPLLCQAYYTICCMRGQEIPVSGQCGEETVLQLSDGLFAALQLESRLQQQQCEIGLLNQRIETQRIIASAHYWAYGESLDMELNCGHVINRLKLGEAISQNYQALTDSAVAMQTLQQRLASQLEQLQSQRSNWNRNHIDSLLRNEQLQHQLTSDQLEMVNELRQCVSALCSIEQASVGTGDQQQRLLLESMEQWLQAYQQWQVSNTRISAVEQAIVQLLDPEGAINQCWVQNVQGLLEDYTCKVQRELTMLESEHQSRHRCISGLIKDIQRHQEQMPRIYTRSLCAESEDQGKVIPLDVQLLCGNVRDSQRTLLNFFQRMLDLRKDVACERLALQQSTLASWQQQLQQIEQMAKHDVDDFFRDMDNFLQHAADADPLPYETFTHNKGAPNLHEQKRNAYGVSVWKKIRMKLEGRDPDSNQRATVAEQVDYVIREATNPDNLAVLYEGWTPWV